ncbi:MAG: FmdB family zinc ribbon protein [Gemmataceae bacterium]
MPTYDYQCDACGHTFEEWQSFKDDALTKCPACKKKKLVRLFGGGAAIIFKGSGFYETDYRKEGYTEAAKKDADAGKLAESTSSAAGETKTESTPAPAAEAKPAKPAKAAKSTKPEK